MKKRLLFITLILFVFIIIAGCSQSPSSPNTTTTSQFPSTPSLSANTGSTETKSISNGRDIFLYSTDTSGGRVTYTGGPGMGMMQGPLSCATCHGADGHGGTVVFMMQSFDVPSITWPDLTAPGMMDHPPYTMATLEQAITQGVDPGGNSLDYPMPRWQMSEQDLNDLAAFIMTLK